MFSESFFQETNSSSILNLTNSLFEGEVQGSFHDNRGVAVDQVTYNHQLCTVTFKVLLIKLTN